MNGRNLPLIFHVIVALPISGAELMLKRLVLSSQAGSRFRHKVVSLTTIGPVGLGLQAMGIEVEALGMRSVLDVPAGIWRLAKLLRRDQPHIVQTWMYHADLVGGLAARWVGIRNVIWGIRTTEVQAGGWRPIVAVRYLCARLSGWLPHTILCAAEASRQSHVSLGYDASRMVVIPNGFDFSRPIPSAGDIAAFRVRLGFPANAFVIGSLGRFNPVKDHANLIAAVAHLFLKYPHVRVLLVGRGLDTANLQLEKMIARTGHADRFVLLGERDDVPECLTAMNVFCLHSRTEGFPNVLAEAMAMGVPCVTTDVGDAAVILEGNGVVVPKEDPLALAQGLMRIIDLPPAARSEMGQMAMASVRRGFSIERARERFEALYGKVLDRREIN